MSSRSTDDNNEEHDNDNVSKSRMLTSIKAKLNKGKYNLNTDIVDALFKI